MSFNFTIYIEVTAIINASVSNLLYLPWLSSEYGLQGNKVIFQGWVILKVIHYTTQQFLKL